MMDIETPGGLEVFHGTIDKIKINYRNNEFAKINSKDLGDLEMKNWEKYKKIVRNFNSELSISNKFTDIKDLFEAVHGEDSVFIALHEVVRSVYEGIPKTFDNDSKKFFYQWLGGRFFILHSCLESLINEGLSNGHLTEIKQEITEALNLFDKVV
jgi:hypothetical protein